MIIKLPWKTIGHDFKPHRACLEINVLYRNLQKEEQFAYADSIHQQRTSETKDCSFEKKKKSGLRKCPGHKKTKAEYSSSGQCSICGGYYGSKN